MSPNAVHAEVERILARAMRAADPVRSLRRAAQNRALPARVRAALSSADEDGVRMAALLVAKLRFERLLRGSGDTEAWFDRDPAAFTSVFRRYHREVALKAFFPPDEAALFRRWLIRRGMAA